MCLLRVPYQLIPHCLESHCGHVNEGEVHTQPVHKLGRRLQAVTQWNCNGDAIARQISVGFVADYGYTVAEGGATGAANAITSIVANANNYIYNRQVNMKIVVGATLIKTTAAQGQYETWNTGATSCVTIDTKLNYFAQWRGAVKTDQGLWHLLTNCYPAPGTVGLASMGVMCMQQLTSAGVIVSSSTGVSSKTSPTWLTVAHEIGHNFDASHAFQLGQGTTGGIMVHKLTNALFYTNVLCDSNA